MLILYSFGAIWLALWWFWYDRSGPMHTRNKANACPACGSVYDGCCPVSRAVEMTIAAERDVKLVRDGIEKARSGQWRDGKGV